MSTSSLKAPCTTCGNKSAGIFRCEGCMQVFCRKHLNEHRDSLSHQLDDIILEYDTLRQAIAENKNKSNQQHSALKQIDQWEKESIVKIQRMADEARNQVKRLMDSQTISKELHDLAQRLQKAQIDDDYVETDLRIWTDQLQKFKDQINTQLSSFTVKEDRTRTVVGYMHVSSSIGKFRNQTERFREFFGNIRIEDDHRLATHIGPKNSTALVRGIGEYSTGKHKIRFLFQKQDLSFVTWFEITPKRTLINSLEPTSGAHGWTSTDGVCHPDQEKVDGTKFKDMKGQFTFEIELELDCDNRKISYINQVTRNRREMNVDITKCPFPWQIRFYLFAIGDSVRLLS